MTWAQDQVDTFIESFVWTDFEKNNRRMSTSNGHMIAGNQSLLTIWGVNQSHIAITEWPTEHIINLGVIYLE